MNIRDITPYPLRLDPKVKERLERSAKAERRSLNSEIALRLERSFEKKCMPEAA